MFLYFYIFYTGSCISSFLFLLAMRVPKKEKIGWVRSRCDHCHTTLAITDLFPLFSFLLRKGTCHYCGIQLSSLYFWIESFGGTIFLLIFLHYGEQPTLFLLYSLLYFILLVMAAIDQLYFILPDSLQFMLFILFFFIHLYSPTITWNLSFIGFFGILILGLIPSCLIQNGMGGGDLKLMALFGFSIGLWNASFVLFIASIFGILFFIIQFIIHKNMTTEVIPFGPFLVLAFFFFNESSFLISLLLAKI